MRSTASIIAAAVVVLASCGGGGDDAEPTTAPADTPAVTPAPETPPPATTPAPTSTAAPTPTPQVTAVPTPAPPLPPTTTMPGATPAPTTVACPPVGDTAPAEVNFGVEGLSSLVGTEIRTGAHDCYERIVIELAGEGTLPGYSVAYQTGRITRGQTGDQVVDLRGAADLQIVVQSWMGSMEDGTLWGEQSIVPTNVQHILELYLADNWEGHMVWGVGLDEERPFRVSTLTDPPRVVVDIAS